MSKRDRDKQWIAQQILNLTPPAHIPQAMQQLHTQGYQAPRQTVMELVKQGQPVEQYAGRKERHGIKGFGHKAVKFYQHKILPWSLPIAGAIMYGPAGATAGGAIAGAFQSRKNVGQNMLKGAKRGAMIGGAMGLGNMATGGTFMGGGIPGLHSSGIPGLSNGVMGASQGASSGGGGILGGLFGGGSSGGGLLGTGLSASNLLDAGLLGTALIGGLNSRTRPDRRQQEENERRRAEFEARRRGAVQAPFQPVQRPGNFQRVMNPNYGRNINFDEPIVEQESFYNNVLPLAQGGYVHGGFIPGNSGGQEDDFHATIPEGSYVLDAQTVSALGDGNTENGKLKLKKFKQKYHESDIIPDGMWNPHKSVRVQLSSGEEVIEPEIVKKIGKGSSKKGAKEIDKMRNNLRKEKGMTKKLPPKTKSLEKYLR